MGPISEFLANKEIVIPSFNWPRQLELNNTSTESLQRCKTHSPSVLGITLTIWWCYSSNAGALGNAEYPSWPSLQCPLWPGGIAPDRVLSLGQIELNCVLMLNWITWSKTVLTFKQRTYAKLNCLKWNYFCLLNWIVWNRTVL